MGVALNFNEEETVEDLCIHELKQEAEDRISLFYSGKKNDLCFRPQEISLTLFEYQNQQKELIDSICRHI